MTSFELEDVRLVYFKLSSLIIERLSENHNQGESLGLKPKALAFGFITNVI